MNHIMLLMQEYHSQHPKLSKHFGAAMASFSNGIGMNQDFLFKGYGLSNLGGGQGTIVDMGGANANTAMAIAKHTPSLQYVVQDLLPVIESFQGTVPEELAERVQFMVHDFFGAEPVKVDAYLFR